MWLFQMQLKYCCYFHIAAILILLPDFFGLFFVFFCVFFYVQNTKFVFLVFFLTLFLSVFFLWRFCFVLFCCFLDVFSKQRKPFGVFFCVIYWCTKYQISVFWYFFLPFFFACFILGVFFCCFLDFFLNKEKTFWGVSLCYVRNINLEFFGVFLQFLSFRVFFLCLFFYFPVFWMFFQKIKKTFPTPMGYGTVTVMVVFFNMEFFLHLFLSDFDDNSSRIPFLRLFLVQF